MPKEYGVSFSMTFTVKCRQTYSDAGEPINDIVEPIEHNVIRAFSTYPGFGCENGCDVTGDFHVSPLTGDLRLVIEDFPNGAGLYTLGNWIYSSDRGLITRNSPPAYGSSWGSTAVDPYECRTNRPYCFADQGPINWTGSNYHSSATIRKQ